MLSTESKTFDDFFLSDEMRRALNSIGYIEPTPVQAEAIPLILAGIDLTLESQTGSGKTAAFAIPVIETLEPEPGRIDVLVMTPTRELAKQVCAEFERLGQFKELNATPIYGGTSYQKQYDALEKSSIVVATPGRLLDLCEKKKLDLSQLQTLVLDEADEMLSMGFLDDILAVIDYLPEERQSLLSSATITEEIKALSNSILFYPEFITLSSDSVAAEAVSHLYYRVRGVGRTRDLIKVLEYEDPDSALIFANTKKDTFSVTSFLKRHNYRAEVLNGDLPQKEREKVLGALKKGEIDFIVATDVAARGIDISELSHVINYALPSSAEVYVHRTGRTGRAGREGKAISLIAPTEVDTFFQVKKTYDIKLVERALPTSDEIMMARQRRALKKLDADLQEVDYLPYGGHLKLAQQLLDPPEDMDVDFNLPRLVARLLSLADRTVSGEFQRQPNGRGSRTQQKASTSGRSQQKRSAKKSTSTASKKETSSRSQRSTKRNDSTSDDSSHKNRRRRRRPSKQASSSNGSDSAKKSSSDAPKRRRSSGSSSNSSSNAKKGSMDQINPVAPAIDSPSETKKMYMNLGRNTFDTAKELVEMLCYMSGMDPEDFGKIHVESSYAFIHVRADYFRDVIKALNGQKWKGQKVTAEPARK